MDFKPLMFSNIKLISYWTRKMFKKKNTTCNPIIQILHAYETAYVRFKVFMSLILMQFKLFFLFSRQLNFT